MVAQIFNCRGGSVSVGISSGALTVRSKAQPDQFADCFGARIQPRAELVIVDRGKLVISEHDLQAIVPSDSRMA